MAKGGGIALGLLLALIAQFLAFALGGAGHGWTTPIFASYALWLFLPLTFATASPFRPYPAGDRRRLVTLSGLGLLADAVLLVATNREGREYFWSAVEHAGPLTLLWLLIFMSWQVILALALSQGEELPDDMI